MKVIKHGERSGEVGKQRERQRQKGTLDSHSEKSCMHKSLASRVKSS